MNITSANSKSVISSLSSNSEKLSVNSYTILAGRLNAKENLSPEDLEKAKSNNNKVWRRCKISEQGFNSLITTYYPSHVKSMMEVDVDNKELSHPSPLCRYELASLEENNPEDPLMYIQHEENGPLSAYPCKIENVSIWFFPYDMVLFSIKINDSGAKLNDITFEHSRWKTWEDKFDSFATEKLKTALAPLADIISSRDIRHLTYFGTKTRQYQFIQTDSIDDDLLYEIATFSVIGIVKDLDQKQSYKPSNDYFNTIIKENSLSVYSNWKALALNDSFTVLSLDDYYMRSEFGAKEGDGYLFFDLLYMRCLLEEFYCFSRNNRYRSGDETDIHEQEIEIATMERYYFYNDLSYDFLPSTMYKAMAKGIGLEDNRKELTGHIKDALRNMRRENEERTARINNMAAAVVQVFALLSVGWTLFAFMQAIFGFWFDDSLWASIVLSVSLIVVVIFIIVLKNYNNKSNKSLRVDDNSI